MALEVLNKIKYFFTQLNYKKVLKQLQKEVKHRKIRVLFYVCENQKWAFQNLYELLEKDSIFEPFIVVGLLKQVTLGNDNTRNNLEENYQFFQSRGMNVKYGVKNRKIISLKEFKPDIVFYEQQWELPETHKPHNVSKYALTAYAYYSLPLFEYKGDYSRKFHKMLFRVFADSKENLKRYEKYEGNKLNNYVVTGYSKLDAYADNHFIDINKIWKNPKDFNVIYAPHHSFYDKSIDVATFLENGQFILDLAKQTPQTTWIFKPHPTFRHKILKHNIMSEEALNQYFEEWEKIGKVYTQGDYFDIFKSSDLMITDSCSFLAEYLPTGKPLIRPLRNESIRLNPLGKKVVGGYYQTYNNEELKQVFNQLVINKNDPKKEIRLNAIKNVYNGEKSVMKIINKLKECLGI